LLKCIRTLWSDISINDINTFYLLITLIHILLIHSINLKQLRYAGVKRLCIRIIDAIANFRETNLQRRKLCKHIRKPSFYPKTRIARTNFPRDCFSTEQRFRIVTSYLVGTGTLSLPSSIMAFELLHYAGQSWLQLPTSHPPCQLFNYTYTRSPSGTIYTEKTILLKNLKI